MIKCKLIVVLLIMLCILAPMPYAMEKGVFQPPSLDGYTLDRTKYSDKDTIIDGIKETKIEVFKNSSGQIIAKYTTNNKTWAWAKLMDPSDVNNIDTSINYVIRDSDGDGKFDEMYNRTEDFYLPNWVKEAGNK